MLDRSQWVIANNGISYESKVKLGVPQGLVLGPLIFIISIESINDNNLDGNLGLFADDTREGLEISSSEDAIKVQEDLHKHGTWSEDVNMVFNNLKFECLQSGFKEYLKVEYNYLTPNLERTIEVKDTVRDLGIWMSSHGDFDCHITKTIAKVRQRMGWISRSFKTNKIESKKFIWRNYITGLLDYNSQIWSPVNQVKVSSLE